MYEVLAISDLHLGCKDSYPNKILQVLSEVEAKKIIIVGDLFESKHLKRLKKEHWQILSKLRKLSKKSEVIYLTGNHCFLNFEFMGCLLGFKTSEEYTDIINDKKFLFIHGDIFDMYISQFSFVTEICSEAYYYLRLHFPAIAKFIRKKLFKSLDTDKYEKNAIKYCELKRCDFIVCGHSHEGKIKGKFLNTGSFCEDDCSYITIDSKGRFNLHHI